MGLLQIWLHLLHSSSWHHQVHLLHRHPWPGQLKRVTKCHSSARAQHHFPAQQPSSVVVNVNGDPVFSLLGVVAVHGLGSVYPAAALMSSTISCKDLQEVTYLVRHWLEYNLLFPLETWAAILALSPVQCSCCCCTYFWKIIAAG